MGMILVTHDLGVVATRTDEIIVMYAGNIVERAPTDVLFKSMAMPYTEALLRSIPRIAQPEPHPAHGDRGPAARPARPPAGCPFAPRCPYAQDKCRSGEAAAGRGRRPATATPAGSRSRRRQPAHPAGGWRDGA